MDRYDWDWNRGYGGEGWRSYDRDSRYPGGHRGGGPGGGGWRDDSRPGPPGGRGGYGGYERGGMPRGGWGNPWGGEPGRGYDRYRRPGPGAYGPGGVGRYGRDYGFRGGEEQGPPGHGGPRSNPRDPYDANFSRYRYAPPGEPFRFPERFYEPPLDVDFDDGLEVELDQSFGEGGRFDGGWDEEPDDGEVQRRVWQSLHQDGFVDAAAIQVEVKEQVVTLRGEVADYMEARYAWDDAWEADGVRGVISRLTVRGADRQESPPEGGRNDGAEGGGEVSRRAKKS